jgi:hypothetical protein
MIICSSFNNVALLHSLLANVTAHQSQEWGTMAALVQRRLPWFIVFYRSMCVLCVICISLSIFLTILSEIVPQLKASTLMHFN